jgi:hypothetical protein
MIPPTIQSEFEDVMRAQSREMVGCVPFAVVIVLSLILWTLIVWGVIALIQSI